MRKFIQYQLFVVVLVFTNLSFAAVGKMLAAKGAVIIHRGSEKLDGTKDLPLNGKDKIVTGKDSLTLLVLNNGSSHKLGENSEIILGSDGEPTILQILSGSLFSLFEKTKKREKLYKIKTRAVVAGVRGTQFFTSYGSGKKPNDNWLCVNEGLVEVTNIKTNKKVMVKAGEGISVTEKGISNPTPLPWTGKLNWSMDPKTDLVNKVNIESAYTDLLDKDYD